MKNVKKECNTKNSNSFLEDEESYLTQIYLSIEDYVIFGSWSQIRKVENDNSMAVSLIQGQQLANGSNTAWPKRLDHDIFWVYNKGQQLASGFKIPATPLALICTSHATMKVLHLFFILYHFLSIDNITLRKTLKNCSIFRRISLNNIIPEMIFRFWFQTLSLFCRLAISSVGFLPFLTAIPSTKNILKSHLGTISGHSTVSNLKVSVFTRVWLSASLWPGNDCISSWVSSLCPSSDW